jgi:hypothetical protein
MKIKLTKAYWVESNSKQWVIFKKYPKKEGKKGWTEKISYHSSLKLAVQSFVDLQIRSIDKWKIDEILSEIHKLKVDVNKALKPFALKVIDK